MTELETFIADARVKKLNDDEIRDMLVGNGWNQSQVEAALKGLSIPIPSQGVAASTPSQVPVAHLGKPSISALQAALQHVLLWVFTLTSTIMLSVVSFALFGNDFGSGSSDSLLTYLVLEVLTFMPFAYFFWRYLRQRDSVPELMTGKVWSIITIVLHSIGLISSLISFALVAILVHDNESIAGLAASGAIAILDGLVVAAYVVANFSKSITTRRTKFLQAFPIALFALVAIFGLIALFRVGPLRADDQTRQNLVSATKQIHDFVSSKNRLPVSAAEVSDLPRGITYLRQSDYEYQLCGRFKATNSGYGSNANKTINDDSYADTYQFTNRDSGLNCWSISNATLQPNSLYSDPSTFESSPNNGANIYDNTPTLNSD